MPGLFPKFTDTSEPRKRMKSLRSHLLLSVVTDEVHSWLPLRSCKIQPLAEVLTHACTHACTYACIWLPAQALKWTSKNWECLWLSSNGTSILKEAILCVRSHIASLCCFFMEWMLNLLKYFSKCCNIFLYDCIIFHMTACASLKNSLSSHTWASMED